jgi:hypothetical protein
VYFGTGTNVSEELSVAVFQVHPKMAAHNINSILLELRDILKNRGKLAVIEEDVYRTVLQKAGWTLPTLFLYIHLFF